MKYEYTREHMLPVMMEVTYEDLLNIQKMARHFIDMEKMPDGIYKADMRKLEREVTEAVSKMVDASAYWFPTTTK